MDRELAALVGKKITKISAAPGNPEKSLYALAFAFEDDTQLHLTVVHVSGMTADGSWQWPFYPSTGDSGTASIRWRKSHDRE